MDGPSDPSDPSVPQVATSFAHPCLACGTTVHVVDGQTQPHHHCDPPEDRAALIAHAWWAGHDFLAAAGSDAPVLSASQPCASSGEEPADPSVPAPQPNPSTALALDEIEADYADPGVVGLRSLGTAGTGPLCRLVAAVPALVAEVRRLRERLDEERRGAERLSQWYNAAQAERDAARAEAERQRERADHNAAAVNENADEIVRLREASRRDGQSRSDAYQRLIEDRDKYLEAWQASVAEAARVREALQAVRDWAEANHGGAARPIEIWPGLKAALDAGLGDSE